MSVIAGEVLRWRKAIPSPDAAFRHADSVLSGAAISTFITGAGLSLFAAEQRVLALGALLVASVVGALAGTLLFRGLRRDYVRGIFLRPSLRTLFLCILLFMPILTLYINWPTGSSKENRLLVEMANKEQEAMSLINEALASMNELGLKIDEAQMRTDRPDATQLANRWGGQQFRADLLSTHGMKDEVHESADAFRKNPIKDSQSWQAVMTEIPARTKTIKDATDKRLEDLKVALNTEPAAEKKPFNRKEMDQEIESLSKVIGRLEVLRKAAGQKDQGKLVADITTAIHEGTALRLVTESELTAAAAAHNQSNMIDVSDLEVVKEKRLPELRQATAKLKGQLDVWSTAINDAPKPKQPFGLDMKRYTDARFIALARIQSGRSQAGEASDLDKAELFEKIRVRVNEWESSFKTIDKEVESHMKDYVDSGKTDTSAAQYVQESAPRQLEDFNKRWEGDLNEWRKQLPHPDHVTYRRKEPSDAEKVLYFVFPLLKLLGGGEKYERVVTLAEQISNGGVPEQAALDEALRSIIDPVDRLKVLEGFQAVADDALTRGVMKQVEYDRFKKILADRRERVLSDDGIATPVKSVLAAARSKEQKSCDDLRALLGGDGARFQARVHKDQVEKLLAGEPPAVQKQYWFDCLMNVQVVGK